RPSTLEELPQAPEHLGALQPVRQRIFLQPHGGLWIFALEWPASVPPRTVSLWGDVLRSDKELFGQWRYEVTSYRANRQGQLSEDEINHCLRQLPSGISAQDWELARSLSAGLRDPREIVARGLAYFHEQKFIYTLNPGKYEGKEALDEFLFRRRSGFCEHYAAAFGTLMRLAGVPSRVVLGYHGGQFNHLGKYVIVHQSDAHAWCEVWIEGRGWERADPTASVGEGDIADFVDMRNAATASAPDSAGFGSGAWDRQPFLRNIRLAWDAVTYAWDSRIADFDDENQRAFFFNLHWPDARPLRLLVWLATALCCLLGLQALWTWWRTRVRRDPLKVDYERFCKRIAAHGVTRQPWEGPATFAERAAVELPAQAAQIRYAADLYVMLRYSPDPGERGRALKEFRKMARV
ncbi:MAG TPA: transglutaminase domain-containing protein, partial [Chthoniobacteraceae bacterium]|nr:transglutaminase domain-containing protein [Chthoniobacteraceae bacterium]